MKKIFGYHITDTVIKHIEEETGKGFNEINKEEFEQLKMDYKEDSKNEYIWHEDDEEHICSLEFGCYEGDCINLFFKIPKLGIYIAEDRNVSANHYYGDIGYTGDFMDYYLTYFTDEQEYLMKSINKVDWYDEEDECFKVAQKFAEEYIDEDGEDSLDFYVSEETTLNIEIGKYVGDLKDDYAIGEFIGKDIYEIKGRLYYIKDKDEMYEEDYCYLQEVSGKCYKYFGYEIE
jgi:hypothetical protein